MMPETQYTDYAEQKIRTNAFVTSVFGWMTGALIITALVALLTVRVPALSNLIHANPGVFIGLVIAEVVLVIALMAGINRMSMTVQPGSEMARKAAVIGALHLYLDFINLFLLLLRLLGRER